MIWARTLAVAVLMMTGGVVAMDRTCIGGCEITWSPAWLSFVTSCATVAMVVAATFIVADWIWDDVVEPRLNRWRLRRLND